MTDLEVDVITLARAAARSGSREARRVVSCMQMKHRGTMLGEHLVGVCMLEGLPVNSNDMPDPSLVVRQPFVLMRVEVLSRIEQIAGGRPEMMRRFYKAFNAVTANAGSRYAQAAIRRVAEEGHHEVAVLLARMAELDPRVSYAAAGRREQQRLAREMGGT
jgi:hypothetical protein